MCIVTVTTTHPHYPLILLNNRDEYLHRPTAPACWWSPPHTYILGGYDLHRAEHGTWLGITKQGRLACLTNFREEGAAIIQGRRSRGAIVNAFLRAPPSAAHTESTKQAAQKLIEEGVTGVGGFSLLFGHLSDLKNPTEGEKKGLAIVSNRSTDVHGVDWLCGGPGETHALSNANYGDTSWPKVVDAERLVAEAVGASVAAEEGEDDLITRLLGVLSRDTLPKQKQGEEWEIYLRQLRHSIFIPPIGNDSMEARKSGDEVATGDGRGSTTVWDPTSGRYGTQKQSVILLDREGRVTFLERTLFDEDGRPVPPERRDRRFTFDIEGW
ncbi:DUF833-domain-containing protein [Trichodelitschia bisporula]|uniref:DUF833-domain-containing protein n=1 Tax=Trichodelitschia bisporula TaxID=703511 RepID=A0A6G1HJC6_9PEZI|nr:DUF833-domain-containing protein [Trichodelitschia bisporula]